MSKQKETETYEAAKWSKILNADSRTVRRDGMSFLNRRRSSLTKSLTKELDAALAKYPDDAPRSILRAKPKGLKK